MSELLAGFITGLAMGMVFQGVGAILLLSLSPRLSPWARFLPLLFLLTPFLWGMVGIGVGRVYQWWARAFPGPGLGSPNLSFTLTISLAMALASLVLFLTQRKAAPIGLALNLAFAALFGWLLPLLAQ